MYADGTGTQNHRKQGVHENAVIAISRNREEGILFRFVVWAGIPKGTDSVISGLSTLALLPATIGEKKEEIRVNAFSVDQPHKAFVLLRVSNGDSREQCFSCRSAPRSFFDEV